MTRRLVIVNLIDRCATPVDRDGWRSLRREDLPAEHLMSVAAFLGQRGVSLERGEDVFASDVLYRNS